MHDQHTVAAPAGPDSNDTAVTCPQPCPQVWIACWWCGFPLDVDETDLCTPCSIDLEALAGGWHIHGTGTRDSPPLMHTRGLHDDAVHTLTYAAVDHDIERVTTAAGEWAHFHQLTQPDVNTYVAAVTARATTRLHALAVRDLQTIAWGNALHEQQLWAHLTTITAGAAP